MGKACGVSVLTLIISCCSVYTHAWYPQELCYEFSDPSRVIDWTLVSRVVQGQIAWVDAAAGRIGLAADGKLLVANLAPQAQIFHNGRRVSLEAIAPVRGGFNQWGLVCFDFLGSIIYVEGIYPFFTVEVKFFDEKSGTVGIALAQQPTVTAELTLSMGLVNDPLKSVPVETVVDVFLNWHGEICWISEWN